MPLSPGDRVRIVSPSWGGAGLFPHRLAQGVKLLETLQLRPELGAHALSVTGHVAAAAEMRAADLNEAFADDGVRAIFCAIGGDHSNQLLPYLDLGRARADPKPLVGYSDITVLQLALLARAQLVTFYAPTVLSGLAEYPEPFAYSLRHLRQALFTTTPPGVMAPSSEWTDEYLEWATQDDLLRARRLQPNPGPRPLRSGVAAGTLVGGCLPSVMHLRGTRWWPSFKGALLFWETPEGGYGPAEVDSHLADLELSGVFAQINGMLVGRPYRYSAGMRTAFDAVILERTRSYRFPILVDLDFGHTDPVFTIPIGAHAEMDAARAIFEITEAGCANA
jgi:muramoyltetrapeptide carboxypeptidase